MFSQPNAATTGIKNLAVEPDSRKFIVKFLLLCLIGETVTVKPSRLMSAPNVFKAVIVAVISLDSPKFLIVTVLSDKAAEIRHRCPSDFEGGAVTEPKNSDGEIKTLILRLQGIGKVCQ